MSASPTDHHQYGGDEPLVHYDVDQHEHEHEHGEASPSRVPRTSSGGSGGASTTIVTRTVAIIKTHALNHRFDIERRIQEASFEIVKERQMEFDTETDPDTLYELFGEDADSFAEGPVWVYVLERRRAVEVWNTLMGDPDVNIARQDTPNSLRSLYGISRHQNGLMGSPDTQTAEIQIAALFQSSPPFPTTELPEDEDEEHSLGIMGKYGSMRMRRRISVATTEEGSGYTHHSSATNPSTVGGGSSSQGRLNTSGSKPTFKARPVPVTNEKPDIVPRTTKAAALRAGLIVVDKPPLYSSRARAPISKERQAQTFANVPGHKRNSTIAVASTAAPTIAPRMTKAAALRLGQPVVEPVRVVRPQQRSSRMSEDSNKKKNKASTFEGVPGHKRRETISVASVKAPSVPPRTNKSAALRQQKDGQAQATSYMFKSPTNSRTTKTTTSGAGRGPGNETTLSPSRGQTTPRRPASQASGTILSSSRPSRVSTRSTSVLGTFSPSKAQAQAQQNETDLDLDPDLFDSPHLNGNATTKTNGHHRRPSSSASLRPRPSSALGAPTIVPRTNKSAALRAAKMEAEHSKAAAAALKKARPPPSSFKGVQVV